VDTFIRHRLGGFFIDFEKWAKDQATVNHAQRVVVERELDILAADRAAHDGARGVVENIDIAWASRSQPFPSVIRPARTNAKRFALTSVGSIFLVGKLTIEAGGCSATLSGQFPDGKAEESGVSAPER